jgi:hypothetical protein
MRNRYLILLATGTLLGSSAYAATSDAIPDNLTALHQSERIVGSLHPDKPGQMRVFASDGSEFTAGQAQWMKGQLRLSARDFADGDAAEASRRLAEVRQLLNEHHHEA